MRANVMKMSYQPHILRKDFLLRCDFHDSYVKERDTQMLINELQGTVEKLKSKAELRNSGARIQLLKYKMPILGGKLWTNADVEKYKNSLYQFVADQIEEYRDKTSFLRECISNIKDDEDAYSLIAQMQEILDPLTEVFGFNNGSKYIPKLCTVYNAQISNQRKRKLFSGTYPLCQFIFQEFMSAWEEVSNSVDKIVIAEEHKKMERNNTNNFYGEVKNVIQHYGDGDIRHGDFDTSAFNSLYSKMFEIAIKNNQQDVVEKLDELKKQLNETTPNKTTVGNILNYLSKISSVAGLAIKISKLIGHTCT